MFYAEKCYFYYEFQRFMRVLCLNHVLEARARAPDSKRRFFTWPPFFDSDDYNQVVNLSKRPLEGPPPLGMRVDLLQINVLYVFYC